MDSGSRPGMTSDAVDTRFQRRQRLCWARQVRDDIERKLFVSQILYFFLCELAVVSRFYASDLDISDTDALEFKHC